ncbi:4-coumarate--CoA ligase 1-like isoform X2 [Ostrinia furnacalis]|uniref:4-coumarate--CoA ligase 1-like isoform X1 n=1 Tax=Ostrinia furnacalis TaxID=93504 RepID=UPI001040033B|nr:4-coumarate--CoA ligase 1-like isoform X1 [Ostrinia furnacalis]XP_028160248.1 4-coumarate--CoA ligase 1-like isoform X1 [Ostrinia furnacalis]XP_028160249.1 4-coumarate--CoA ligase 1-like isoform X1 [Ostrinia furnacalis]XP_028160250.1 4-coumarate--CoA ligase 1-like isoform X1 [Ostrinia furnacalis]XP_028160251.1 4-coumarate--CoA ligase 1-like isoform X1 [Ostrinia furnacalis]XP_028160253.1 4-coumarate--CoA ligase 1-like isoform X2 [Ostrinia furnacalis]
MVSIINNVVHGGPAFDVPAHLSFGQFVLDQLREYQDTDEGNNVALIDGETDQKITYNQLLQEIVNFGTGLKKLGVKRGDVVALCSENKMEYISAALAVVCCGATITPLNIHYTKDEMIHVLNISRPNIMISSEAAMKLNYSTIKVLPFIKTIIQLDGAPAAAGVVPYSRVLVAADARAFQAEEVQGWTDTAYILYSSGTTGLPKGVMLTHLNILYSAANFVDTKNAVEDVTFLTIVPWYHAYGLMSTINYLITKRRLVYFSGFNPHKYLNAIQKYKINILLAVPPIVVFLAKSPLVSKYDLSSVWIVLCGAAPLSVETINDAKKQLPSCLGIFQGYGMTETSLLATSDLDIEKSKPGSGGYPVRGVKAKVVDLETGKTLGARQNGEICLKGPLVMKGYAGNEAATREMMDGDGYLRTGDIGYYDEDGCFFVVDRLKELIKYKGHQVPPAEVESVLLEHAAVAESAVVGAADEQAGELPTAFVVLKPNARATEKDIIDFAATRLSQAKRLHGGVIFVEAIPKNPSGKILRRVLRQKLQEKKKSKL